MQRKIPIWRNKPMTTEDTGDWPHATWDGGFVCVVGWVVGGGGHANWTIWGHGDGLLFFATAN